MYFDNIKLFNVREAVLNIDNIYAHKKEQTDEKEKLIEHMDLTYEYFQAICREKNLDTVFENMEKKLLNKVSFEGISLWKELLCNAIYMHDIGKINCNFQTRKMKNNKFKDVPNSDSKHSMLSACIYFDHYLQKIYVKENGDRPILLTFLLLNSYLISKHHGMLEDFPQFKDKFIEGFKTYCNNKKLYPHYKYIFKV
ncbi:MAG: CRISPR-associated endonuclease Cas3'', partial [Clostridiaceae bacterium]